MFSVIKDIPVGSLLRITKSGVIKDIDNSDWTSVFSYDTYYRMTAYTHITSTTAIDHLTQFDCSATACTFVTGASQAEDYSGPPVLGSSGTPPIEISKTIGLQFQQTINAQVITGGVLTGETHNTRGYQQGTGSTGGDTVDLGTLINTSTVPNPTTVYVDPSYTTTSCGSHQCYYDAFAKIQDGVNAVAIGGTINVAAGNYIEQLIIDKNLTLIGAGEDKTIIQSPNTTLNSTFTATINGKVSSMKPIITIKGANANISALKVDGNGKGDSVNNTFFVGIGFYNAGGSLNHVTVTGVKETPVSRDYQGDAVRATNANGSARTLSITNSTISDFQKNGLTLSGSGLTVTVSDNHITGTGANVLVAQNGIVLGTGVTGSVTNNTVKDLMCDDSTCGNDWYSKSQATAIAISGAIGPITVSGNTVSNSDIGIDSNLTSGISTISNNTLIDNRYFGILFENGEIAVSGGSVTGGRIGILNQSVNNSGNKTVHNVNISGNSIAGLKNDVALSVDATNNWWGTANSTEIAAKISGSETVNHDPWYLNPSMSMLSNAVSNTGSVVSTTDNFDVVGTTPNSGEANVPTGVTDITLGDNTVLDLSSATSSEVSTVEVGGNTVDLTKSVTLQSGIDGQDVVLTNSNPDVAGITASIPDGTKISGPAGWNGTIMPPTSGTPEGGSAPAGFAVGGTVISIGSPDGTLVFNKAVTIVLPGVTGTVGYRPSGSTVWQEITNVCTGTYENPTGAEYPGECAINNGTDTKILTFHFTSFGGLTDTQAPNNVKNLDATYKQSPDRVQLTWDVSDTDTYQVYLYRGKTKDFTVNTDSRINKNDRNDTNYSDYNVTPGEKYYYKVVAVDATGNKSSASIISIALPTTGTNAVVKNEGTAVLPAGTVLGAETTNPSDTVTTPDTQTSGKTTTIDNSQNNGKVLGADTTNTNGNNGGLALWQWLLIILVVGGAGYFGTSYFRRNRSLFP